MDQSINFTKLMARIIKIKDSKVITQILIIK